MAPRRLLAAKLMPRTYRYTSREGRLFLDDVKEHRRLTAYMKLDGASELYRRRSTAPDALCFADILPAVLRTMFVANWQPAEPLLFARHKL